MDLRKSIPAVLLLALAVPPVQAKEQTAAGKSPETVTTSESENGLAAETISLAARYMRCRIEGDISGDEAAAAWEKFYPSCDAVIRRYAGKFRSRGVDVDDCTQEVWTDLSRSLPGFAVDPSRGRFTSWLYTIVRSKATDIMRRQIRRPAVSLSSIGAVEITSTESDPAQAVEKESDRQMVRRAMNMLKDRVSETSYRVLQLRHFEGLAVSEVAEKLGLTSEQVWVREHRMRNKLRDLICKSSRAIGLQYDMPAA